MSETRNSFLIIVTLELIKKARVNIPDLLSGVYRLYTLKGHSYHDFL